jgi:large subunit ribosomal protein L4
MKTDIYNTQGKSAGTIDLPESVFGLPWNADLVHQVVLGMQSNARTATTHAKDRSEVSGTGKKPWRQKGTGNARHGSRRSPIWVGGGVAHGPRKDKDYSKKINKKVKTKALFTALSQKLRDGQILFVESVALKDIKTKDAEAVVKALSGVKGFETIMTDKKNNIFMTLPAKDATTEKSFRNLSYLTIDDIHNLNPVDVMKYRYMIISAPKESLAFLESKLK